MSSQEVFVRLPVIPISVVPTAKLGEAAAVNHDRGRPTGAPTSAVSSARNGLRYPVADQLPKTWYDIPVELATIVTSWSWLYQSRSMF
jgi:hypothetical protein